MNIKRYATVVIILVAIASLGASCQKVESVVDQTIAVGDQVDPVIQAVKPLIPPQYRGWIELAAIAGLALRAWRTKQVALRVTRATTEAAKDGKIDFKDTGTQILLARAMGAAGKALVDQAQGKKRGLPL